MLTITTQQAAALLYTAVAGYQEGRGQTAAPWTSLSADQQNSFNKTALAALASDSTAESIFAADAAASGVTWEMVTEDTRTSYHIMSWLANQIRNG